MNKRPKPGDTEDDLLQFQREFLSGKEAPSASVVRRPGDKRRSDGDKDQLGSGDRDVVQMDGLPTKAPVISPGPPEKKSRFKASREKNPASYEEEDPEARIDRQDTSAAAILTEIIERDTRNAQVLFPKMSLQGFPSVFHRGTIDTEMSASDKEKKKSLFARQMEKHSNADSGIEHSSLGAASRGQRCDAADNVGESSLGGEEQKRIHEENVAKLSAFSEEEILAEQKKLLETLDPKLISFLKSKKTSRLTDIPSVEDIPMETGSKHGEGGHLPEAPIGKEELPIKPDKDWVHMDTVESDKLAWMKDLPPPGDAKTGQSARFDFHGNIMSADVDIPVNLGLHHHGDEPERAGYTLDELFHLARSSNTQQRSLALQTLGRILEKAKAGVYLEVIQKAILPSVLDAGIVFLLRWALDDTIDSVLISALSALHALLINTTDEASLDRVFPWYRGVEAICQCPTDFISELDKKPGSEENEAQETDADVVRKDVILALVSRMTLLPRLRYFLETWRPQAPSVVCMLEILIRIARHSSQSAYEVMNSPNLIEMVVKEFIPTSWKSVDVSQSMTYLYGYPLPCAVKLLRTVVQAGRNMAAILISQFDLLSRLMVYVAMDVSEMNLLMGESYSLQTESLRLWRVCLLYGLGVHHYLDLYTTLMERLRLTQSTGSVGGEKEKYVDALNTSLLGLLEAVVHVTGRCHHHAAKRYGQGAVVGAGDGQEIQLPEINWSHVSGLLPPVKLLTEKLVKDRVASFQSRKCDLTLVTAVINFISTYYSRCEHQPKINAIDLLQDIEVWCCKLVLSVWKSFGFRVLVRSLSQYSNVLSVWSGMICEESDCLPELCGPGAVPTEGVPILRPHSPYPVITAILRLMHTACRLHKGMIDKLLPSVIDDEDLCSYMKKIVNRRKHGSLQQNYLTKFETQLQYYVIKLNAIKSTADMKLHHEAALLMLIRLQYGDEHLAHDLLSTVLFNTSFISEGKEEEMARQKFEGMDLSSESSCLRSATQQQLHATRGQLLQDVYSNLPNIRATYMMAFSHMTRAVHLSRARILGNPFETESFFTSKIGECLIPEDWMFAPLVDLYNKTQTLAGQGGEIPSSALVGTVTNCLRWIFMLECWRPHCLGTMSVTLKISRVMCAFLTGNDLFLESWVHCYLAVLLREYSKPAMLDQMNFEEEIPGVTSFYDLYISLLQQYQAVSYGDSLFGCYVLIPLQQRHNLSLRKAVWGEYSSLLRSLSIPVKELLVPIERYLEPEESDLEMIRLYAQSLLSQTARPCWAPLMYLIAVHHVNRFIYNQDGHHSKLKSLIMRQILASHNDELKKHLLYYKSANGHEKFGMDFYEELPPIRTLFMKSLRQDR